MDGVTALQKHLVRVKLEHAEREAALERTVAELKGENDELKAALDDAADEIATALEETVLLVRRRSVSVFYDPRALPVLAPVLAPRTLVRVQPLAMVERDEQGYIKEEALPWPVGLV